MKLIHRSAAAVAVLFAAALLAPALLAGEPTAQPGGAAPFKIGVANIKVIIDKYMRTATLEDEIDKVRMEESDKIAAKRKELEEIQVNIKMLSPGSSIYQVEWKKMRKLEMEINFDEDSLKADLQMRLLRATKEVYEDIINVLSKYSKDNGFSMIFKVETGDIESESKADLILRINSRAVLYFDETLDVSEKIVAILNEKYTGKKIDKPADGTQPGGDKPADGTQPGGDKPADGTKPGDKPAEGTGKDK